MSFERAILHLDLDAFFVAVELLRRPELRGLPLIIGGVGGRGVVSSCSYEARAFGVRSAMPVSQALRLCPQATVVKGDMASYGKHSKIVRQIIDEEAPLYEQASIDEFYLDLTGMDRYIGCWQWSRALRARLIRETGLPLSMGLSVNKTVSKIAAGEAKPNGELLVPAGSERDFLAPMPVGKLPFVGKETEKRLLDAGIGTIGRLAATPPELLERDFGKHGRSMWERANGIDNNPVTPAHERVSISCENTFHADTTELRYLHDVIRQQVSRLGFELRQAGKLTACVAIKLRYSNFETITRQSVLSAHTAHDSVLTQQAIALFDAAFDRKRPVRLLGVRFSNLLRGAGQLDFFEKTEKEARLLTALDQIRTRYGKKAVVKGNPKPKQK